MTNSSNKGSSSESSNNTEQNMTSDRRDVASQGSSLSGSTERNNAATEKAIHPDRQNSGKSSPGNVPSGDSDADETVDQDPGERQKENQNDKKDDGLAA
jgi:hypothetical protein